jgi:L-amino acid N-acyltransferase YncA
MARASAIGVQIDNLRKPARCGPMAGLTIRAARAEDAASVAAIYNAGIAGRQATFETRAREPEEIAAEAERRGMYELTSRVFTTNAASRAVHRAAGFEEVGLKRFHGRLEGEWKHCVLVERLLGDAAAAAASDESAHARGSS